MNLSRIVSALKENGSSAVYSIPVLGGYLSARTARYVPEAVKGLGVHPAVLSGSRAVLSFSIYSISIYSGLPSVLFNGTPLGLGIAIGLGVGDALAFSAGVMVTLHEEKYKNHEIGMTMRGIS